MCVNLILALQLKLTQINFLCVTDFFYGSRGTRFIFGPHVSIRYMYDRNVTESVLRTVFSKVSNSDRTIWVVFANYLVLIVTHDIVDMRSIFLFEYKWLICIPITITNLPSRTSLCNCVWLNFEFFLSEFLKFISPVNIFLQIDSSIFLFSL